MSETTENPDKLRLDKASLRYTSLALNSEEMANFLSEEADSRDELISPFMLKLLSAKIKHDLALANQDLKD